MDQFCHLGLWQKNQRPWTTWARCQNSMRMIGSVDFKDRSKILFMLFLENYLERRKILNFMPLLTNTHSHSPLFLLCLLPLLPFLLPFPSCSPSISIWSCILQWIFLTNLNSNLHASSQHRGFQNKNWNRNKFFSSSSWAAFFSLQWVPRIWIPNCRFQDHLVSWWKERQYSVENVGRGNKKGKRLRIIHREHVFKKQVMKEKIDKVFFPSVIKKGTRDAYFLKI